MDDVAAGPLERTPTRPRKLSRKSPRMTNRPFSAESVAVVADDLTGSLDTAAPFAERCGPIQVYVTPPDVFSSSKPNSVLVSNTATRQDSAAVAAAKVRQVTRALAASGFSRLFKKIDSTLQGNLGSEIEQMLACSEAKVAVVCPAFAAQGRRLEDGFLRIRDSSAEPLHLPSLIRRQTKWPVEHMGSRQLRELLRNGELAMDLSRIPRSGSWMPWMWRKCSKSRF